jgi:hypothetical protein
MTDRTSRGSWIPNSSRAWCDDQTQGSLVSLESLGDKELVVTAGTDAFAISTVRPNFPTLDQEPFVPAILSSEFDVVHVYYIFLILLHGFEDIVGEFGYDFVTVVDAVIKPLMRNDSIKDIAFRSKPW